MSSEENLFQSSSTTVHEFDETQTRRLSLLLPLILGVASRQQDLEPDSEPRSGVRVVMIDRASGTMIVIDGSGDLESMFQELSGKSGVLPASKDSIEAMPTVVVTEEGMECAICLEAYTVGGEAREMPCKHRFHSGCIEQWLGIHGSCPICRFLMPVEEENKSNSTGDDGEQDGGESRGGHGGVLSVSIWVRSRSSDDPMDGDDPMDVDSESVEDSGDSNSNSDSPDENSAAEDQESQEMEMES